MVPIKTGSSRMKAWQKGMRINGQWFDESELQGYCLEKIGLSSSPDWMKDICRFLIDWISDSGHMLQSSSGTTGRSKELRLSKQSMMASATATCRHFGLQESQTALLCLPVDFIAGKMMIVRSMVCGLDLHLLPPVSQPDLSSFSHIDFAAMVPLQVMNLLRHEGRLQTIRKLIIGGAEISHDLIEQLHLKRLEAYATFGMAETCSHVAIRRLNGSSPEKAYHALPGITLTKDERGCLVIDAPYLSGQVITNDMVRFTGANSFIWQGRYDNLINSGGIKIVPEEVEESIRTATGFDCVVVDLPDEKLGQKPILVLEKPRDKKVSDFLPQDFSQWFPHNMKPEKIEWMDELPRNQSYKVDRNQVRSLFSVQNF